MKKNKLIVVSLLFTFIAVQVAVAQDITILTSDEAEFKILVNEANESKTLKNMLEDIGEPEAEETIPLPDISKKVFEKVLPVLKAMSQAEEDAKAKAGYDIVKQIIQNEIKGIEELKDFISALAYLDIPMAQPTSLKISDYAALYSLLTDLDQKTQEDILAAMDNNFFDFLAGLGTLSKVNEELEKKLGKRSESTWPTQEVNDAITQVAGAANTKLLIKVANALNDDKLLNGAVRRFVWLQKNIPSYSNQDLFNKKLEELAGQFSDPDKIKKLIKKHAIQKEYNIEKEFTLQDYIEKNGLQNLIGTIKNKVLDLKERGLTSLEGLEQLPLDEVERLDLSDNLLTIFGSQDLLWNLKELLLNGNNIIEYDNTGLKSLAVLDLVNNNNLKLFINNEPSIDARVRMTEPQVINTNYTNPKDALMTFFVPLFRSELREYLLDQKEDINPELLKRMLELDPNVLKDMMVGSEKLGITLPKSLIELTK